MMMGHLIGDVTVLFVVAIVLGVLMSKAQAGRAKAA
jgi:hypothetical protein